jgi:predicted ferric reductase
MQRIKFVWWFVFIGVSLTYWFSINAVDQTLTLWALRKSTLYYTGIMATAMMSLGVVLAMRLPVVENLIGGLDQHYRLHKWVGISTAVFALAHWLIKLGPKWLIKNGFADAITFKTPPDIVGFFSEANFLTPARSFAKDLGEWAIYALLVLVVLALWKRFPYRAFFKTHRLMAIIYIALVFHSVVLFGQVGWLTPVGIFMALVMAIGCVGAVISLMGKVGAKHRVKGRVKTVTTHTKDHVLEVHIDLGNGWHGHEAGQFAFVTFDPKEGAHPFSISSPWRDDGEVVFHIKALGDYTAQLPAQIQVGQDVTVEGPYGRFKFDPYPTLQKNKQVKHLNTLNSDQRSYHVNPVHGSQAPTEPHNTPKTNKTNKTHETQQIWISGGIGITPFLSRLQMIVDSEALNSPPTRTEKLPITLYYCTRIHDSSFVTDLLRLSQEAGITLHIIASGRDQPLTIDRVKQDNPYWLTAHYWFCGPAGLGQSLHDTLIAQGVKSTDFHQELFEMR